MKSAFEEELSKSAHCYPNSVIPKASNSRFVTSQPDAEGSISTVNQYTVRNCEKIRVTAQSGVIYQSERVTHANKVVIFVP